MIELFLFANFVCVLNFQLNQTYQKIRVTMADIQALWISRFKVFASTVSNNVNKVILGGFLEQDIPIAS